MGNKQLLYGIALGVLVSLVGSYGISKAVQIKQRKETLVFLQDFNKEQDKSAALKKYISSSGSPKIEFSTSKADESDEDRALYCERLFNNILGVIDMANAYFPEKFLPGGEYEREAAIMADEVHSLRYMYKVQCEYLD